MRAVVLAGLAVGAVLGATAGPQGGRGAESGPVERSVGSVPSACEASIAAPVALPLLPGAEMAEGGRARLGFSINKGTGLPSDEWDVLTSWSDMVLGLDDHGYTFPGYLDNFRAARPQTPAYCFMTAMAIQRQGIADWRFKYLDHYEDAFLHCADPASLKVVVVSGATRLFWVRDCRKDATSSFPSPIGVTSYAIESAPSKDGPWTQEGAAIPENGTVYYSATLSTADATRWYRLRTRLADSTEFTDYSWPTQSDPSPAGFAYWRASTSAVITWGMWGSGPSNPADVVLEWGNGGSWGYGTGATSKGAPVNGITEYTGTATNFPPSGAWLVRLRSKTQGITTTPFDPSRRNNRLVDRYGAHFFKPDHERSLTMHKQRLASAQALGLAGARLDFAIDSYPTWLVAGAPQGEDAPYADIKPRMLAMLGEMKNAYPAMKLILNGISVTSTVSGTYDYLAIADGADCEYIGWSKPTDTAPFRDSDMLDGAIGVAHVRGKSLTCYSYAAADNLDARLTSFARYWLIYAPNVYYHYQTADYHQTVDYFPEYDLVMGAPLKATLASRAELIGPGGVYRRAYTGGAAYYNPGASPVTVTLGAPSYLVVLHGTRSPKQGGTGSVTFDGPCTSVTLQPRRGAIVVKIRQAAPVPAP